MTIGMLFAFIAYKQQFVDKATRLVEKAIELRMIELHLQRLADITLAEPEPEFERGTRRAPPAGRLEVRNLSFRYVGRALLFEERDFRHRARRVRRHFRAVRRRQDDAAEDPAGTAPADLRRSADRRHSAGDRRRARVPRQTGVVMQDDQLLSGSIADNICFFDRRPIMSTWRAAPSSPVSTTRSCACRWRTTADRRHGRRCRAARSSACCWRARCTAGRACCSWTKAPRISNRHRGEGEPRDRDARADPYHHRAPTRNDRFGAALPGWRRWRIPPCIEMPIKAKCRPPM